MSSGLRPRPLRPAASRALWTAAVIGTLHAAWSVYWAFGGTLLLETVGEWAVEASDTSPVVASLGLSAVSAIKLAGAWIPLLAETELIPWRGFWRILGWIGGPFLILYGVTDVVAGSAVLSGLIQVEGTDRTGVLGHTLIWGPHFALWGLALTTALALSRGRSSRSLGAQVSE